jgi:hypothetical protein
MGTFSERMEKKNPEEDYEHGTKRKTPNRKSEIKMGAID